MVMIEDPPILHCEGQSSQAAVTGKERGERHEEDGWETASEGEDTIKVDEGYEDALTEEEQKQKALSQANDAKFRGNEFYGSGNYEESMKCYASALDLLQEQQESVKDFCAMCYSNSAMCHLQLKQFEEAVRQSSRALELNPAYFKAFMRRAQAQEKLDNLEEALTDYKNALELNPENQEIRRSIGRLEPVVAERREKLKEEMIGKLKDLGNNILGRFGMSLDNFKTVQDPNTGSYSISFQR